MGLPFGSRSGCESGARSRERCFGEVGERARRPRPARRQQQQQQRWSAKKRPLEKFEENAAYQHRGGGGIAAGGGGKFTDLGLGNCFLVLK